jgi:hypothetical protein
MRRVIYSTLIDKYAYQRVSSQPCSCDSAVVVASRDLSNFTEQSNVNRVFMVKQVILETSQEREVIHNTTLW